MAIRKKSGNLFNDPPVYFSISVVQIFTSTTHDMTCDVYFHVTEIFISSFFYFSKFHLTAIM